MKVKATQKGYYGNKIIEIDEEFEILKPEHFSERWMISLEPEAPTHKKELAKKPAAAGK